LKCSLTRHSGFLEGLCDYLYDHLRPRILHEPSLEVLCGVCTVLQALMVQDVTDLLDDDEQEYLNSPDSAPARSPFGENGGDYFSSRLDESPRKRPSISRQVSYGQASSRSTPRQYSGSIMTRRESMRPRRKPLSRLHTEVLLKMVLQDAQTRLVFRAQALVAADVQYYAPREGDLDYPDKLPKGE
jgi:hypothetical protein